MAPLIFGSHLFNSYNSLGFWQVFKLKKSAVLDVLTATIKVAKGRWQRYQPLSSSFTGT